MTVRIPQDVLAGLFLVAIAGFFLFWGWNYPDGRAARMGPGWLPHAVCFVLLVLGASIAVRGARAEGRSVEVTLPPIGAVIWIIAGTLAFVAIERLGLVITAFLATVLASLPGQDFRWRDTVLFAAVLSGFCVVVFIVVLAQPLPMWPS